jgi:site-specific recombinase XerD
VLNLLRIPTHKKLPVILSRDEVRSLLGHIRRPVARLTSLMMYSCGLRVSEATHLRPRQIDSRRMVVCVRNGKGYKDRYVPLPQRTLELLRAYWREHRPDDWLFPSKDRSGPIQRAGVLKCIKAAVPHAGIAKNVSCHTLRHSYATHLLEAGMDLRIIQGLLGHRSPRTTLLYVHLTQSTMKTVHRSINDLMGNL